MFNKWNRGNEDLCIMGGGGTFRTRGIEIKPLEMMGQVLLQGQV